jgi:hypothetical protein
MGCSVRMPCAKFLVAALVTCGTLTFGCIMLATGGASAPLAPFYCSLITSSVAFWAKSPSYNEDPIKEEAEPGEKTPLIVNRPVVEI